MRKRISQTIMLATAMMLASANNPYNNPYFGTPRRRELTPDQKRQRLQELGHQLNPVNLKEYEFTIHGEKIMARNKKTALKIYANRHKK